MGLPPSDGEHARREPTPRWVKVFGAVAVVVLLLLLALALVRPDLHGPSRHAAGAGLAVTPDLTSFDAPVGTT